MNLRGHPLLLGLLATCAAAAPALAQARSVTATADVALYQGPDRTERLVQGAKREGEVSVYASAPTDDMAFLTAAFEKKHGIRVRVWRASSEHVLQRGLAEARGGRFEADVFETNAPEMEVLHREKVLQEVKSPYLGDLAPQAIPPHREWIGTRINLFAAAYNTRLVRKDDIPRTYRDLLHPRWKGRLGIEAEDLDWFAEVIRDLGEAQGLRLFREIVAGNGLSVRKGHTLLANLVVSGEVPLALTVYQYKAEQLRASGAPIDWFVIPPAIARVQAVGLARRAPHAHAGVLFVDFMLTEAQALLLKRDFVPTSRKVTTPLDRLALRFVDPGVVLDDNAKWAKLYREIVTHPAR